jgi:hypothetical protein
MATDLSKETLEAMVQTSSKLLKLTATISEANLKRIEELESEITILREINKQIKQKSFDDGYRACEEDRTINYNIK